MNPISVNSPINSTRYVIPGGMPWRGLSAGTSPPISPGSAGDVSGFSANIRSHQFK